MAACKLMNWIPLIIDWHWAECKVSSLAGHFMFPGLRGEAASQNKKDLAVKLLIVDWPSGRVEIFDLVACKLKKLLRRFISPSSSFSLLFLKYIYHSQWLLSKSSHHSLPHLPSTMYHVNLHLLPSPPYTHTHFHFLFSSLCLVHTWYQNALSRGRVHFCDLVSDAILLLYLVKLWGFCLPSHFWDKQAMGFVGMVLSLLGVYHRLSVCSVNIPSPLLDVWRVFNGQMKSFVHDIMAKILYTDRSSPLPMGCVYLSSSLSVATCPPPKIFSSLKLCWRSKRPMPLMLPRLLLPRLNFAR